MITDADIQRINALARKAKTSEGLTDAERAERAALRRRYLEAVRANLTAQLDHTVVQTPDGARRPLRCRDEAPER